VKLPRDITGVELVKRLAYLEYRVSRQTGSHIRVTTQKNGIHSLTIPAHNPLKIGTLSSILNDVANHFSMTKETLLEHLSL
jgi:predicted RNA binding protein YcfA (HicA-like mRNA interferase family)